jgi:hypothetical protein
MYSEHVNGFKEDDRDSPEFEEYKRKYIVKDNHDRIVYGPATINGKFFPAEDDWIDIPWYDRHKYTMNRKLKAKYR